MARGNRTLLIALGAVVLVALVAGAALLLARPETPLPQEAGAAPAGVPTSGGAPTDRLTEVVPPGNFALVAPLTATGQAGDLSAYRGKALLVNFWATWCAPCIKELPSLAALQEKLGGADFAVVTIALDEPDPTKVAPFLAAHGAGALPALIDGNRTVDKVLAISALPTSVLVDRAGLIRARLTGDATWDCGAALEAVQAFIADGSVSAAKLEPCK